MKPGERPKRNPLTALVLGWILPGAGHFYGGQRAKGVLFFGLITGTILGGLILSHGTNLLLGRLWYVAQFCGGGPAILLTFISEHLAGPQYAHVQWADRLHEVGTLYTAVAGFLNLLVIMDAYVKVAYPNDEEVVEVTPAAPADGSAHEENA
jgi:hypothetical protein